MKNTTSVLPRASLIVAGTAALFLLALYVVMVRPLALASCLMALVALVLGIAGVVVTRGKPFALRVPAVSGIVLGVVVCLWAGLIFVLTTPF
jgi:hypothetical protein